MLLRIYFEENDLQGFESVKTALKTYLYRNKSIPLGTRTSLTNFIRFTSRLFHLRGLYSGSAAAAALLQQIKDCKSLTVRIWLQGKAEGLLAS